MNRLTKKVKNRLGTSLVEMLATVLLLGIMGIALTAGVATVSRTHEKIVRKANEQTLLSTSLIEMRNWIRYCSRYYETSDNRILFLSDKGFWVEFANSESGILVKAYTDYNSTSPVDSKPLVADADGEISKIHSEFESIEVNSGCFVINDLIVRSNNGDDEPTRLGDSPNQYVITPLKPVVEVRDDD